MVSGISAALCCDLLGGATRGAVQAAQRWARARTGAGGAAAQKLFRSAVTHLSVSVAVEEAAVSSFEIDSRQTSLHAQPDDMDPDKDNANPTILNASDLPSRRRESSVKKNEGAAGVGLFDDLIPPYSYLHDPFEASLSSSDSDDGSVEDIDEQEIYGEPCAATSLHAWRPAR